MRYELMILRGAAAMSLMISAAAVGLASDTAVFHLTSEEGDRMDEFTRVQWQEEVARNLTEHLTRLAAEAESQRERAEVRYDRQAGRVTIRGTEDAVRAAEAFLATIPGLITEHGLRRDFHIEHAPAEVIAAEVRRILKLQAVEDAAPVAGGRATLKVGEEKLWHGLRVRLHSVESNDPADLGDDTGRFEISSDGMTRERLAAEGTAFTHGRFRVSVRRVIRPIGWDESKGASVTLDLSKLAEAGHDDPTTPDFLRVTALTGAEPGVIRAEYNSRWRMEEAVALILELDRPDLRFRVRPRLIRVASGAADLPRRAESQRWVLDAGDPALGDPAKVTPLAAALHSDGDPYEIVFTAEGRSGVPIFCSLKIDRVRGDAVGGARLEQVRWSAKGSDYELSVSEEMIRIVPGAVLVLPAGEGGGVKAAPHESEAQAHHGLFVVIEFRDLIADGAED